MSKYIVFLPEALSKPRAKRSYGCELVVKVPLTRQSPLLVESGFI